MDAAAEGAEPLRTAGDHGLNDVVSRLVPTRLDPVAQCFKEVRRQMCGLERLRHGMRCVEQPLVERLVLPHGGTLLGTDADRGQAVACQLDRALRSRDVSAGFRHSAAGVLDQGADDHIRTDVGRLALLHEFAVAVIHNHKHVLPHGTDGFDGVPDFGNAQRLAVQIALGALNEHHLDVRMPPQVVGNLLRAEGAVRIQVGLEIIHTEVPERPVARLPAQSDHLLQRIVRLAGDGVEDVARTQKTEQPDGERVGSADDAHPDKRRLRTHDIRPDFIQHLPPAVIVAVAGRGAEHGIGHPVPPECLHDFHGIPEGRFVNCPEARSQLFLRFRCQIGDFFRDFHFFALLSF